MRCAGAVWKAQAEGARLSSRVLMFEGPTMSTPHAYLYAGWGADPQPWESLAGWRVASKRLGALPRIRWGALARGCGSGGQRGAAAAEGGRHLNRREGTARG